MINAWTLDQAVELCTKIEGICPEFGVHVALTGGCLYKQGFRKDLDIVFYRIRQVETVDLQGLIIALEALNIYFVSGHGFVLKFEQNGKLIDALFPEEIHGSYEGTL